MKRIVGLIFFLVVVTGCSGNINIDINEDGSIDEEITIKDNVASNEISKVDYLDDLINTNGYDSSYLLNKIIENNYLGVELSKSYEKDNLCSSLRSSSLNKLMYNFSCEKEDDKYIISGNVNYFVCDENCFEPPEISDGVVNITLPTKAKKQNADEVNGNTYTWYFDGVDNEKLELEFRLKGVNENSAYNKELIKTVIILVLGLVTIGILVGSVLYNKYKNNRLEY